LLANHQSCRIKTIQPIDLKALSNARKLAVATAEAAKG
jgi:hypothetical protein